MSRVWKRIIRSQSLNSNGKKKGNERKDTFEGIKKNATSNTFKQYLIDS